MLYYYRNPVESKLSLGSYHVGNTNSYLNTKVKQHWARKVPRMEDCLGTVSLNLDYGLIEFNNFKFLVGIDN